MREYAITDRGGLELLAQACASLDRVEALRVADIFRARVVDSTIESFVFELTGESAKIDAFIELMTPLGLIEICRTGVVAVSRGKEGI